MNWLRRRLRKRPTYELLAPWPDVHISTNDARFVAAVTQAAIESHEISILARYNGEVSRGIVHTPEWKARMAELQQRFYESREGGA